MIKKLVLPDTRRRILCKDFLTKTSPCLVDKASAIQLHTLIFGQLLLSATTGAVVRSVGLEQPQRGVKDGQRGWRGPAQQGAGCDGDGNGKWTWAGKTKDSTEHRAPQ